ncbi:MAG TPA: UDP-N-acetylenolpyruvoylglucosamine reductase, partial [Bacteroidetes bacterium]|nr:UDP-N-acetylenolpyruvoylglucosamine reductase [Bacteroidota bacterium]
MHHIQENISLKRYNTFGIDANARYFCEVRSKEDLISLMGSGFLKKNFTIF